MENYQGLMKEILVDGYPEIKERTGTGTLKVFARQLRFDLRQGFPLVTTKKIHLKSAIHELLWMIRGETNIKYLNDNDVTIWDEWADDEGELGPVYGKQWRDFEGVDQLAEVEQRIKQDPADRRLVITAWNPPRLSEMALPPCPMFYQFFVARKSLSCQVYIRSWDVFIGGPFNIAEYALLTLIMAQVTELNATELIVTSGDTHLYLNHRRQAFEQLSRKPRPLPTMTLNSEVKSIFDFKFNDFTLDGYDPHPHIKAEVSV